MQLIKHGWRSFAADADKGASTVDAKAGALTCCQSSNNVMYCKNSYTKIINVPQLGGQKKLYKKSINKTSAKHQGPMLNLLKSFADIENLVRLSL